MRGTLRLIDAEDFPVWAAALATRRYWRRPVWLRTYKLTVEVIESVVEAVAQALDGRILTRAGLADEVHRRLRNDAVDERLHSGWGELLKIVAIHGRERLRLCFGPQRRSQCHVRSARSVAGRMANSRYRRGARRSLPPLPGISRPGDARGVRSVVGFLSARREQGHSVFGRRSRSAAACGRQGLPTAP